MIDGASGVTRIADCLAVSARVCKLVKQRLVKQRLVKQRLVKQRLVKWRLVQM